MAMTQSGVGVYKSKLPRRQINDESLPRYLPKAYMERRKLYAMHFCFSFISRMWDMSIVLLMAHITNNSLSLVAWAGFLASVSVFLFMPFIGHHLDTLNRLTAVQISLSVKIIVLTVAYGCCGYLTTVTGSDLTSTIGRLCLYSLPVWCAVAGLSFTTITQCVEKDWVVVLSDGDSAWLAATNSVLSQIDLGCASLAPAVTGLMFELMSANVVAGVLLLLNAVTTACLLLFMRSLYWSWPALAFRVQKHVYAAVPEEARTNERAGTTLCGRLRARARQHVGDFLYSGCAGAMLSYALLYLTVLSFGSLMTVYLRWAGVSASWIGVARGLAALTGFAGALGFPLLNRYAGLYKTAQLSVLYQAALLTLAASSFFWAADRRVSVVVVIVSVLLSRAGLWVFDLSVRQIAQETIAEAVRGRVNGQWKSLAALFEMGAFALALALPDPRDFWVLVTVSASMVWLAAATYALTSPFSPCVVGGGLTGGTLPVRSALHQYEYLGGDDNAVFEVEMHAKSARYSSGGTVQPGVTSKPSVPRTVQQAAR